MLKLSLCQEVDVGIPEEMANREWAENSRKSFTTQCLWSTMRNLNYILHFGLQGWISTHSPPLLPKPVCGAHEKDKFKQIKD